MRQHDLALRLLQKAAQDELVVDRLIDDCEVPDEVLGLHLQQAAQRVGVPRTGRRCERLTIGVAAVN